MVMREGIMRSESRYLVLLLRRFRRRIAFLRSGHDSLKLGETVVSPAEGGKKMQILTDTHRCSSNSGGNDSREEK